jgi:hypothetical protein
MKARFVMALICRWAVAPGSLLVSAYGVYLFEGADFRRDTLEMGLYCGLPFLSFPVFLLSFWSLRWSVAMHWILAAGYLAVYSALDWRTCAEMGYCHGVMQTVLQTLATRPVGGVSAVAVLNLAALAFRHTRR